MDLQEIERAMHTLACGDTNFDTVARLASLVIVRDHLSQSDAVYQAPQERAAAVGGSDFLDAVADVPISDALRVIDEHMEALRVVIPKEYESVMRKLYDLK